MRPERGRRLRRASLALGLWLASFAALAVDLPADLAGRGEWRRVGSGSAHWLGFHLYDVALWGPPAGFSWQRPFALSLRYARGFSRERLAATSVDEIRRLGERDEARLDAWREQLEQAFVDVEAGDVLVGLFEPDFGARFYAGGALHAEIADAELARRFFAIWLDPRTREPDLRVRLLGESDGPGVR
ncbi:MAG: chalcone isomerase family protein [Rhodocyclaceae bacterium]|nr:chalcone isomerase family protein [Rhodocyclaceae bacterium]